MKILVIDGQGGGVGRGLVAAVKAVSPGIRVTALGANAAATAAMLRAGADEGATGENAICYQCESADIILGAAGILMANAMLGEISPAIAGAVSASPAEKVLLPLEKCALHIVGVRKQTLESAIKEAALYAAGLAENLKNDEKGTGI